MTMLKSVLAFLLLSTLHLARLDVPDRTILTRFYTSPYRLNTIKEWKGLHEEAALMKRWKSKQSESEAEIADLLSDEEENWGKKQQIMPQSAAAYSVLQSELPRARRSLGFNAAEVGKSRPKYIIDAKNAEGFTPLYLAVTNDHADIAASFLQAGADLQQTFFAEHRNLLHEAARKGAVNSIRWLVKAGLSINATDDNKWTALHYAANSGQLNATKTLIELKCCIDCKSSEGYTALRNALVNDFITIAVQLIESGADVQQTLYDDHRNLLHEASRFGAVNSIHWLVKKGFGVNATDDDRWLPLHYAANYGKLNATKALIDLKSCIDCKSSIGYTALRNAVRNDHTAIADLLVEFGADVQDTSTEDHRNLLHEASGEGAVNAIYWLLNRGHHANATDDGRFTPLHYAAYYGRLNATKALLGLKSCIDCKNSKGFTALRNAVRKDHTDIADLLVESGADVQETFIDAHRNLLHEASGEGAVNAIYWLLNKGLNVNATDNNRQTPLHYAAFYGRLKATKALLDLKSCMDCKSSEGFTALRNAVRKDHTDIADLLVESGADVQETFIDGHRNLLHEASGEGAVNAIYWLVSKGLDVNATDDSRWAPLHYAAYYGRLNATKTLIELKCCIECHSSGGFTALRNAVVTDHTAIAALLVESGADVQQKLYSNHSNLLHEASGFDAVNSIYWLVNKGLDVNATDNYRWTPLHYAAHYGRLNATKALIQLKCCIHCKSSEGYTALRSALVFDHTTTAALLVESGADLLQTFYDDHRNMLHEASIFGAVNSIHWLVKKGFSVNATDDNKFTPLHYAAYFGKMNASKTLIDLKSCINCRTAEGNTPLDLAEMRHHQDIAAFLKLEGATSN